ncbi:MAG: magnesium transporter [Pseudorhodobacter sp. PARRP1]|nr:MAG: magnesium transporter [Pseudorhodobacter sp. PARRP1]
MLTAYHFANKRLEILPEGAPLDHAEWIDLLRATPEEEAAVRALGVDVPTLADMEEIEISNRLYHEEDMDYLTVVLPGQDAAGEQVMSPVCFAVAQARLVTVRHHSPRPFETYPSRAGKSSLGCSTPDRIFLGLIEEVIGRLADHLEIAGVGLDKVSRQTYHPGPKGYKQGDLENALSNLGAEGERLGRVRLSLLTLGRALNYVDQLLGHRLSSEGLGLVLKGELRDIEALEVHADFLSSRLGLMSDATMGRINLAQNTTVRIVSVVAVLFSPPTLIASIYGMNFVHMPELPLVLGYPLALLGMVGSAVLTYAVFRWKGWL